MTMPKTMPVQNLLRYISFKIDHVTQQPKQTCQRTCRGPCLLAAQIERDSFSTTFLTIYSDYHSGNPDLTKSKLLIYLLNIVNSIPYRLVSSTLQIVQTLVQSYCELVILLLALEATETVYQLVTQMSVEMININLKGWPKIVLLDYFYHFDIKLQNMLI